MHRRKFIKTAAAAGLAAGVNPTMAVPSIELPRRRLGRTGEELSIVGFGGIVVLNKEQEHANRSVARAVEEHGINYFDVAPSYGNAEERLGPALEPYRKNSFLACKTTERSAEGAQRELHASLERMRTDYFDLYQLHAIKSLEDVEKAFGPGGVKRGRSVFWVLPPTASMRRWRRWSASTSTPPFFQSTMRCGPKKTSARRLSAWLGNEEWAF